MCPTSRLPPLPTNAVPPGPQGSPVLGMAGALRGRLLKTLLDNFHRFGDVVAYRVGPRCLGRFSVALHHPDAIMQVFRDRDTFGRDTTSFRVLRELFGANLVTTDGPEWVRQKRLLQPLFTRDRVAEYTDVIRAEADAVVDRAIATEGAVIDAGRAMEEYALRVLGHTLFKSDDGIDADTIGALERLVPTIGGQVRSRATRFIRPDLRWPTPANRQFRETREQLHAVVTRVLERRQSRGAANGDLIGKLVEARDPDGGAGLDAEEIRDQALIFLISGHTTTSNALTSTLYLLASNPDAQEDVAAAATAGSEELVRAAVQEGMRLYPPSYVIGRRLTRDATVAGYELSAGTNILVSPWVTHRHPAYWRDPYTYDPTRFLDGDEKPEYAYFPFGGGGRACIGRHFALLEATILVGALLRRYRLEALDPDLPVSELISLRPDGPVRLRCLSR
jgi:cytochrome P450